MLSTLLGFWLVVYGLQYGMVVLPPFRTGLYTTYDTPELCAKAGAVLKSTDPYLKFVCVPDVEEAQK